MTPDLGSADLEGPDTPSFVAFISYRRKDGSRAARWLRRHLIRYRLPEPLRRDGDDGKLGNVYLDRAYESANNDFFEQNIRPAIVGSEHLILCVSPSTSESLPGGKPNWLVREVDLWRETHDNRAPLLTLVEGQYGDPIPAGLVDEFPNIDIVDLRPANRWLPTRLKNTAFLDKQLLKLVAALSGLGLESMPQLRQEELRRRVRQRRMGIGIASIVLGVIITILAVSAYKVRVERDEAREQREIALAGYLSSRGLALGTKDFDLSLLLAVEALSIQEAHGTKVELQAESNLLSLLQSKPYLEKIFHHFNPKKIGTVSFNWAGDEFLSRGGDSTVRIWHAESGEQLGPPLQYFIEERPEKPVDIWSAAFSPDGKLIAAGVHDDRLVLWDAESHKIVRELQGHADKVRSLAFRSDHLLASGDETGIIHLWRAESWEKLTQTDSILSHNGRITGLAFGGPEGLLVSGSGDRSISLWDVNTSERRCHWQDLPGEVRTLAVDQSDQSIAAGFQSGELLWLAPDCSEPVPLPDAGQGHAIEAMTFSGDGSVLATVGAAGQIRVWDTSSHELRYAGIQDNDLPLLTADFDRQGFRLVTSGDDGMIRLRDIRRETTPLRILARKGPGFFDVAASAHGALAMARDNGLVDIHEDEETCQLRTPSGSSVRAVAFGNGGHLLATGDERSDVILWQGPSFCRSKPSRLPRAEAFEVSSLAFRPQTDTIALAGDSGNVVFYDLEDETRRAYSTGGLHGVRDLAFDASGQNLYAATGKGKVVTWSERSDRFATLALPTGCNALVVATTGEHTLGVGCFDKSIRLITFNGTERDQLTIRSIEKAHDRPVTALTFHPAGTLLASGSYDATARLWHIPELQAMGEPVADFQLSVTGLTFRGETGEAIAVSIDGTAVIWDTDQDRLVEQARSIANRSLTLAEQQRETPYSAHPGGEQAWR